jgi:outer membrane lipoprotein LolB
MGLAAVLALMAVGGCAHHPDPLIGAARFEGRLSVQVAGDAQRSFSAGFELVGSEQLGRLVLTTPIGTQAAQADWSPQQVRLRAGGDERLYSDLESLARDVLDGPMEAGFARPARAAPVPLTGIPPLKPPVGGSGGRDEGVVAALPLAALFDWLRGRPWPRAVSQARSGGFEQLGWVVDLSRRAEGWLLVRREAAPEVTVRVLLDEGSR